MSSLKFVRVTISKVRCIAFVFSTLFCFSPTVYAQPSEVLPICGIVAGADEWDNLTPAVSLFGDAQLISSNYPKKGLHYGCAAQLRMTIRWVEETDPPRGYWVSNGLVVLPRGRAVPEIINPADGDGQFIHLSVDAPVISRFVSCYPGFSGNPDELCPESIYNGNLEGGVMIYRMRSEDGTFSGPWIVSRDRARPPFVVRKVGECITNQTGCQYEVRFKKKLTGEFILEKDVQVLIQIPARLETIPETGEGWSSAMVIPFLIRHSNAPGDPDPDPGEPNNPAGGGGDVTSQASSQAGSIATQLALAAQKSKGLPKAQKQQRKLARRQAKKAIKTLLALVKDNSDISTTCTSTNVKQLKKAQKKAKQAKNSSKRWGKLLRFFNRITSCLG